METLVKPLIALVGVAVVVLAALALITFVVRGRIPAAPYRRAKALFSPAELRFLASLSNALGPRYCVFGKVRVGDLAEVRPGLTPKARRAALNRIAQKHFDFVVCTAESCEPLFAVELNDRSHSSTVAQRRDAFLASVCEAIAMPLVTIVAAGSYDIGAIRAQLAPALIAAKPTSAHHGT
jgi:hypothetical protein